MINFSTHNHNVKMEEKLKSWIEGVGEVDSGLCVYGGWS